MSPDGRIEDGRVAKDLLPVVGAQPGELVGARHAVACVGNRTLLGGGRGDIGEQGLGGHCVSLLKVLECCMNTSLSAGSRLDVQYPESFANS